MPDKTTTLFKDLNNQKKDTIKKLMKKNCDRLTQNDLLTIRNTLYNHYDQTTAQTNEQSQFINYLLNRVFEYKSFRPMDQRSFPEYVIDILYDWVKERIDYDGPTFTPEEVFNAYFADGTMTYNTQMSINDIHAFWNGFHEDDLERETATFIFNRPETFLVQQSYYMAIRILNAIFDDVEKYDKQAFLDYIDNDFDPYTFDSLIY